MGDGAVDASPRRQERRPPRQDECTLQPQLRTRLPSRATVTQSPKQCCKQEGEAVSEVSVAAQRARELLRENARLQREVDRLNKALLGSAEATWQVFDVVEQHYRDLEHHQQAKRRREQNHGLQEDLTIGSEVEDEYDLGDSASQGGAQSARSTAMEGPGYSACGELHDMDEAAEDAKSVDGATDLPGPVVHLIHSVVSLDRCPGVMLSEEPPWEPAIGTLGSSPISIASLALSGGATSQDERSS